MKTFKLDAEIGALTGDTWFGRTIGPDAVAEFLRDCRAGEKVTVEINSPGGDVISGLAMANSIKNSPAHVTAHVVGIAASMASVIACACDEIRMEEGAFFMIHDPWAVVAGNAADLRKEAEILDSMKEAIKAFYRGKFDRTPEEVDALMADETWWSGAECAANGLRCEVIASDVRMAACATRLRFSKCPAAAAKWLEVKAEAETPASGDTPSAAAPEGSGESEGAAPEPPAQAAPAPEATPAPSAPAEEPSAPCANDSTDGGNWQERYRGASKKINELQAKIVEAHGLADSLAAVTAERDSLAAEIANLKDQLGQGAKDLAAAKAEASGLAQRLDEQAEDLARERERAERLESARQLLTAGVLTPASDGPSIDEQIAAAKTPRERIALRAKKAKSRKL